MSVTNEIVFPITYSLEDTFTYARYRALFANPSAELVNDGLLLAAETDSYNCNLGANDKMYSNLVADGDTINLHFQFPDYVSADNENPTAGWKHDAVSWYISIEILNVDGTVIESDMNNFVGLYSAAWSERGFSFQNIQVNYTWPDCFYFRIKVKGEDGSTLTTYYTEPFKLVDCQNTILLSGDYTRFDNFNFFYGGGDANIGNAVLGHTLQIRVEGELINEAVNISQTQTGTFTIASKQNEVYTLRLAPVPPYQAKRIANVLSAPTFTVDGIEFIRAKGIQKNNPDGNMWIIETELERDNTELTFDCN
jgi:hypothetical protein